MDTAMSKKFQRGGSIHNMRCIIKGSPGTGKSALFRRLQGKPFAAEYNPTRELQSAHVNWKHKSDATPVVKVEVWDVVDKSKDNELDVDKYGERAAYYLKTGAGVGSVGQVDADMIDVFRGANAMVITSNPQQRKTFDYIKDVLSDPRIAPETPIAILANFRDLVTDENRQVSREEYAALVQVDPRHRFVFECSSKNCYGLKELYDFLTVPFLKLQERELVERLQSVRAEFNTISGTMSDLHGSQNYAAFTADLVSAAEKAKLKNEAKNAPSPKAGNPMVKQLTLDEPEALPQPAARAEADEPEPEPAPAVVMTPEQQAEAVAAAVAAATAALAVSVGESEKKREKTKPKDDAEVNESQAAETKVEAVEPKKEEEKADAPPKEEPKKLVVVKKVDNLDSSSSDSEDSDWDAPSAQEQAKAKEKEEKEKEKSAEGGGDLDTAIDDFNTGEIDDDFWD